MSYDTLKVAAGRQRIDVVDITLEKCSNTYGVAPCVASGAAGSECYQGWHTCQDKVNYASTDFVISVCTTDSVIPDGCIPLLSGVTGDAGQLDPENSLGKRGQITVTCFDAPHDDSGIDPYAATRSYVPLDNGTFWPKLRARFPYYQGRKLEWYQGYYPFVRSDAKKRTYIIESLRGWGRTGTVQIIAKDPLKLADDKRAQWPRPNTGLLNTTMTAGGTYSTLDVLCDSSTEYDLEDYESVGVITIGSECIQYTGVTPITGGVTLTGVARGPIGQYETVAAAHAIGANVQKAAYFDAMKAPKIFQMLLERGGSIPAAYITYATWEALYDLWWGGMLLTRIIVKPTGVTTLIKELIPQSGTWGIWFDNELATIRYDVVRPLDYNENVQTVTDDDGIIADSVTAQDEDSLLTNQVLVRFAQVDPTKAIDDQNNYEAGFLTNDVGSQDAKKHGQVFAQKVNACWHPSSNRSYLTAIYDRLIQSRANIPVRIEFEMDRKNDDIKTASFVTLETMAITTVAGIKDPTLVRIIQQDSGDDEMRYVARQAIIAAGFGRWAPDSYAAGYLYSDATPEERQRYVFWADADGLNDGSYEGKKWL